MIFGAGHIISSHRGQAGGGAPNPYALNLTYGLVGNGHLGGNLGQINNGSIPNSTLKPYTSTEYEFGADLRFLDNRIGLDVAYYISESKSALRRKNGMLH